VQRAGRGEEGGEGRGGDLRIELDVVETAEPLLELSLQRRAADAAALRSTCVGAARHSRRLMHLLVCDGAHGRGERTACAVAYNESSVGSGLRSVRPCDKGEPRCAALQRGCPALQRGCPAVQYCAAARCAALRQRGAPCSARPARRRARGTSPARACAIHSPPLRDSADGSVSVGVDAVPGGSHVDGTALSMRIRVLTMRIRALTMRIRALTMRIRALTMRIRGPTMRIRGPTMRTRGLVNRTRLELPLARPERRLRLRVLQHAATPRHATYSTPHRAAARETAARTMQHAVYSNTATARCGGLLSARLCRTSAHSTAPLCTCDATAE
jgi:hypothetical protein